MHPWAVFGRSRFRGDRVTRRDWNTQSATTAAASSTLLKQQNGNFFTRGHQWGERLQICYQTININSGPRLDVALWWLSALEKQRREETQEICLLELITTCYVTVITRENGQMSIQKLEQNIFIFISFLIWRRKDAAWSTHLPKAFASNLQDLFFFFWMHVLSCIMSI